MNIRPTRGWVLTKPVTRQNKTKSGLDLPDIMEKDVSQEAEVIEIGPRPEEKESYLKFPAYGESILVKPGDTILYRPFAGMRYGEYLLLQFGDLIAVVKN